MMELAFFDLAHSVDFFVQMEGLLKNKPTGVTRD